MNVKARETSKDTGIAGKETLKQEQEVGEKIRTRVRDDRK